MRFMWIFCHVPRASALTAAVWVAGLGFTIRATQTATAAPAASHVRAPVSTNAAPTKCEAPKSVFVIPETSQDGRDPFFPLSTRLHPVARVMAATRPAAVPELELKGISGTVDRRLAIINNRTFERGEEGEVVCNAGRVRVTCMEIKDDSVRIVVNGQERVLSLHTKF